MIINNFMTWGTTSVQPLPCQGWETWRELLAIIRGQDTGRLRRSMVGGKDHFVLPTRLALILV